MVLRYKFQYTSEENKKAIIIENESLFLVEIQNITEGDFLIFSDAKPVETVISELKTENLKLRQEDLNNKEAIAELYIISMGGF